MEGHAEGRKDGVMNRSSDGGKRGRVERGINAGSDESTKG